MIHTVTIRTTPRGVRIYANGPDAPVTNRDLLDALIVINEGLDAIQHRLILNDIEDMCSEG